MSAIRLLDFPSLGSGMNIFDPSQGTSRKIDVTWEELPGNVGLVREQLRQDGWRGQPVGLGVPAEMVLSARIDTTGLRRRHREEALLYRLEEHLPVDAEQMSAWFTSARSSTAAALAVASDRIQPVLAALADESIEVAHLTTASLLKAWSLCRQRLDGNRLDFAVFAEDGVLIRYEEGEPRAFYPLLSRASDIGQAMRAELLSWPAHRPTARAIWLGDLGDETREAIEADGDVEIETVATQEQPALLAAAVTALNRSRPAGWVEWRKGPLAVANPWRRLRGLLSSAAVLWILLPVVLASGLLWRAQSYARQADAIAEQQRTVFSRLYPNQPAPVDISGRLESELRLREGVTAGNESLPQEPEALETLRQVVASLPPSVRLRITKVRLGPRDILLEGETRSHSDAEFIATRLRQKGLAVESPRTENLVGGGVQFVLVGQVQAGGPA